MIVQTVNRERGPDEEGDKGKFYSLVGNGDGDGVGGRSGDGDGGYAPCPRPFPLQSLLTRGSPRINMALWQYRPYARRYH